MTEKQRTSVVKNFLAGGFGGVCAIFSGHPFDTIKVRIQTMPLPRSGEKPQYAGPLDCLSKTVKNEGIKGLYKGMGAPIIGSAPVFALSFMGFGLGKKMLQSDPNEKLNLFQLSIAGGISGILTTVIMAPGERIKCILQVESGSSGPVRVVKSLYRTGGIRSVYKGTVATLLRDVPASGAYFASYEILQRMLAPEEDRTEIGVGRTILAGGLAGVFNWIVAIAPDVLKSRLQTAPEGRYTGVLDVFRKLVREEGPRALFKGAGPVMARAFPANACCFLGYEFAMYSLNYVDPDI